MTAQINDICFHRKIEFSLAGVSGRGLFDPAVLGDIKLEALSSACWRGYQVRYAVAEGRLQIKQLSLGLSSVDAVRARAGRGPVVFGALPSRRPDAERPLGGWTDYNHLSVPVPFTGGLLLADDFIHDLYVHMGFHAAWKYCHVREVLFQDGRIVADHDRSESMACIRRRLMEKHGGRLSSQSFPHEPASGIDHKEMDAWMAECLTQKYFLPAAFPAREGRKYEPRKQWTFAEALKLGPWEPIPNCPGRHVLRGVSECMSISKLLGPGVDVLEYHPSDPQDRVFVARLIDGGIISYLKSSGVWVHTLGDSEGFVRKLNQLGIQKAASQPKGKADPKP